MFFMSFSVFYHNQEGYFFSSHILNGKINVIFLVIEDEKNWPFWVCVFILSLVVESTAQIIQFTRKIMHSNFSDLSFGPLS